MKTKTIVKILVPLASPWWLPRCWDKHKSDITGKIVSPTKRTAIAVADMRGTGDAQRNMDTFNSTLWDELANAGILKMVAKSVYPLEVPQRPQDFKAPTIPANARRGTPPTRNGPWLTDWSGPPVNANDLAFGYTAVQDGKLVLYGWALQHRPTGRDYSAQSHRQTVLRMRSTPTARRKSRAILPLTSCSSLALRAWPAPRSFSSSDRSGAKEIWSMDYDGSHQQRLTQYNSTSSMPAVSPDGKLFAFTTYAGGNPQIRVHSVESGRRMPFYNPVSSTSSRPPNSRLTASNCCSPPPSTAGCKFASPVQTAAISAEYPMCARSKSRPR